MWWRDLVNRYAHGQPMPWQSAIIWRCEECGGHLFWVRAWDEWEEGFGIARRFLLECPECGRIEANMVETVPMG